MDYQIVWSNRSLTDLKEIAQFIAEENPSAAEETGLALIERVEPLAKFPQMGTVFVKLRRDDVRELSAPPYRIIYRIIESNKSISILTVWHGAQQEPDLE